MKIGIHTYPEDPTFAKTVIDVVGEAFGVTHGGKHYMWTCGAPSSRWRKKLLLSCQDPTSFFFSASDQATSQIVGGAFLIMYNGPDKEETIDCSHILDPLAMPSFKTMCDDYTNDPACFLREISAMNDDERESGVEEEKKEKKHKEEHERRKEEKERKDEEEVEQNMKNPKIGFYFLDYIGVSPLLFGKGVGSLIMKEIEKKADKEGMCLYLVATTERSRQFYLRHHFVDYKQYKYEHPTDCTLFVEHFHMYRKPRYLQE